MTIRYIAKCDLCGKEHELGYGRKLTETPGQFERPDGWQVLTYTPYTASGITVKMDSHLATEPKVLRDHARNPERGWHVHIYDIADVELSLHGSSKEIRQFAELLNKAVAIIDKREAA